ncbi:MAG: hypothetical protein AB1899_02010 [Pseudomonadota bacterium]
MNTTRIAKILGLAALSSLSLLSGASQADGWGFYVNNGFPPAPAFMPPPPMGKPGAWCPPQVAPRVAYQPVNAAQADQRERIFQGIRSGQLTQREAEELFRDQRKIDKVEQRYLADGRLTRGEWADLNDRLRESSREIYEEKHDRDRYGQHYGHGRDHGHPWGWY